MRKTKKTLAILAIVAMVFTMIPMQVFAADATTYARIGGTTQYDTAAAIAKAGWTTADTAVIAVGATGNSYDALAAGPLAAKKNAPILLTEGNQLTAVTKTTLQDLGVKNVIIVGGTGVIKQAVEDSIKALGISTSRLAGFDAAETSVKVAQSIGSFSALVLAGGRGEDALSVAAIAAAQGYPILYTDKKTNLPDSVANYVAGLSGVSTSYVIGGVGVIQEDEALQLPGTKVRYGGYDAYDTNLAVIQGFASKLSFGKVYVANGQTKVDALAGAALAAKTGSAIVLTDNSVIPAAGFVSGKLSATSTVTALGGTAAVSDSILKQIVYSGVVEADPKITGVTSPDSKNLVVTFDKSVVTNTVQPATVVVKKGADSVDVEKSSFLADAKTLNITTKAELAPNTEYTVTVTPVNRSPITKTFTTPSYDPTITVAKGEGSKALLVTFSKAVDSTKAVFEVKKGDTVVAQTAKFDDAKKVATLTFTDVLAAGDYTVNVTGLTTNAIKGTYTVPVSDKISVDSVSAVGAKTLKASFTGAADDSKAKFAVKKGGVTVNVSKVEWNTAKTEATLTTATKLTSGDYTVTVSGIELNVAEKTAKVEDEKVAKIAILSTNAVLDRIDNQQITVSYKITNQYGEDVTKLYEGGLTKTSSKGDVTLSNGIASIKVTSGSFTKDEKVNLSLLDPSSTAFASQLLTVVDAAKVADIAITGLYNADKKTLTEGDTGSDYKLVVVAKDQYGNTITTPSDVTSDTIVNVSDTSVLTVGAFATATIDGSSTLVLPLDLVKKAGKATVSIISKTTGNKAQYEVTVTAAAKADKIVLTAPDLAVAGEKVEIPFSVTDQFGNPVTKYSALTGITFSDPKVKFVQNYNDGTAKLVYDDSANLTPAAGKVLFTATSATTNVTVFTLDLKAPAVATVITGTKNVDTNVVKDGSFALKYSNIVVKDQYGRDFSLKDKLTNTAAGNDGKYNVIVSKDSSDTKITLTGAAIDSNTASVTVKGAAKGTGVVTLALQKVVSGAFVTVSNSSLDLNVTVAENKDFVSYELKAIDPIYDSTDTGYQRSLVVYGVTANGTKVKLDDSLNLFTVSTNNAKLTYASGKFVNAGGITTAPDYKDVTVKVTVVVAGETAPVILTQDVVVTNPVLTVASAEWADGAKASVVNGVLQIAVADATTSDNLLDTLVLKDQFGVSYTLANYAVTITNVKGSGIVLTNNGTSSVTITGAAANNSFNLTIVVGGKAYTTAVVVTN